jgi:hypothetical protein
MGRLNLVSVIEQIFGTDLFLKYNSNNNSNSKFLESPFLYPSIPVK